MILERADGRNDDDSVGVEARGAALDVEELLGAEVGGEACFGDGIVAQAHCGLSGLDGVAAMSDVCERAAVDERGSAFERLDHVGLDGIL